MKLRFSMFWCSVGCNIEWLPSTDNILCNNIFYWGDINGCCRIVSKSSFDNWMEYVKCQRLDWLFSTGTLWTFLLFIILFDLLLWWWWWWCYGEDWKGKIWMNIKYFQDTCSIQTWPIYLCLRVLANNSVSV